MSEKSSFPLALPPLLVERAVAAALDEDLGTAGDITTDAIIPADARGEAAIVARQAGVVAGTDLAEAAFRALDPEVRFTRIVADGGRVAAGGPDRHRRRQDPRPAERRADRAQLPRPAERHRHADRVLRQGGSGNGCAHRLHAQDHARIARLREIRGAGRRRHQSPFRPLRRGAGEGQPYRRRRRPRQRAGAAQDTERTSRQDRGRGRYARSARRGASISHRCRAARQYGHRDAATGGENGCRARR